MRFCKAYCSSVYPLHPMKDKVVKKGELWATEKLLKSIPIGRFPSQQVVIDDHITVTTDCIYNCNTITAFHKKL